MNTFTTIEKNCAIYTNMYIVKYKLNLTTENASLTLEQTNLHTTL